MKFDKLKEGIFLKRNLNNYYAINANPKVEKIINFQEVNVLSMEVIMLFPCTINVNLKRSSFERAEQGS